MVLGSHAERLALVRNHDLLNMAKLGRASTPLDLLSYRPEDEQPSVFFLRETPRQSILTVFNWTRQVRSHVLRLTELGLPEDHAFTATNVLRSGDSRPVRNGAVEVASQAPESVVMLKLTDNAVPERPPAAQASVPTSAAAGETIQVSARAERDDAPVVDFHWDFGDGTSADGPRASHAYTLAGDVAIELTTYGVDGTSTQVTFPVKVGGSLRAFPTLGTNRRFTEQ
jgi:hypothetical protein